MFKLKELRQRAVLSTRELAGKAEVSPATVWRIERGEERRIRPATMRAIAKALKVAPTEIEEFAEALGARDETASSAARTRRRTGSQRARPASTVRPIASTALLSEAVLARDWLSREEDEAWAHL